MQIKRDLDIAMNDFLKEENVGKEKAAIFQLTFKQVSVVTSGMVCAAALEFEIGICQIKRHLMVLGAALLQRLCCVYWAKKGQFLRIDAFSLLILSWLSYLITCLHTHTHRWPCTKRSCEL